jgi:hypothetical protein
MNYHLSFVQQVQTGATTSGVQLSTAVQISQAVSSTAEPVNG